MKTCVVLTAALLSACSGSPDSADAEEDIELSQTTMHEVDSVEYGRVIQAEAEGEAYSEDVAVAEAALTPGEACRAACWAAAAAGCERVQKACRFATVFTIGRAAIPCGTAIAVACFGGAGYASICSDRCPKP